jgi:hypothetical protein
MTDNSGNLSTLSISSSGKLIETMCIEGQILTSVLNYLTEYKIEGVWTRKEDKVTFGHSFKYEDPKLGW